MSFLHTPSLTFSAALLALACLGAGCGKNKDDTTSAAPSTPAPSDAKPQPPAPPQAEPAKPGAAEKVPQVKESEEAKKARIEVRNKNLAREAELRTFLRGEWQFSGTSAPSAAYSYENDLYHGQQNTIFSIDDSGSILLVYRLHYISESGAQVDHIGTWWGRYSIRVDGDRYTLTYAPTKIHNRSPHDPAMKTDLYKIGSSYTCELLVGNNEQGRRYFTLKKCSEFSVQDGFTAPYEVAFTNVN